MNRDNDDSGTVQNTLQDPAKLRCNKTERNNTEVSDTDPIYSDENDWMSKRAQLEEYFSQPLEVDLLLRLCPDDEDTIYQIVDGSAGRNRTEVIQHYDLHHKAVCPDRPAGGQGGVSAVPVQSIPRQAERPHPVCGKTGACPAWRSARPASVAWNAMPKSTASTMPSARTHPRCRPGIWSFSKPRTQKPFNSAFKEYSASLLNKDKRPSVLAQLHELVQAAAELPGKVRHKEQERGL